MAQQVKNPPVMQETQEMWVQPLGQKVPWRRNWHPLQYSCLENSMDRKAWATIPWVAKSQTQLSTQSHKINTYESILM